MIKEYVANGQAVAFSGHVLCGYGTDLQLQDGVIYETTTFPTGHGQLVVGYDDHVGVPGKRGAARSEQLRYRLAGLCRRVPLASAPRDGLLVLQQLRNHSIAGCGRLPALARAAGRGSTFGQRACAAGVDHPGVPMGAQQSAGVSDS
jgi:hypothetical protein